MIWFHVFGFIFQISWNWIYSFNLSSWFLLRVSLHFSQLSHLCWHCWFGSVWGKEIRCVSIFVVIGYLLLMLLSLLTLPRISQITSVYFHLMFLMLIPIWLEILLLMKMEKVANFFKARFVVNVSELGEDDPLARNVRSLSFSSIYCNL